MTKLTPQELDEIRNWFASRAIPDGDRGMMLAVLAHIDYLQYRLDLAEAVCYAEDALMECPTESSSLCEKLDVAIVAWQVCKNKDDEQ